VEFQFLTRLAAEFADTPSGIFVAFVVPFLQVFWIGLFCFDKY